MLTERRTVGELESRFAAITKTLWLSVFKEILATFKMGYFDFVFKKFQRFSTFLSVINNVAIKISQKRLLCESEPRKDSAQCRQGSEIEEIWWSKYSYE